MSGASAAQRAIRAGRAGESSVISLQELHGRLGGLLASGADAGDADGGGTDPRLADADGPSAEAGRST
jgi:hypothetical protein